MGELSTLDSAAAAPSSAQFVLLSKLGSDQTVKFSVHVEKTI